MPVLKSSKHELFAQAIADGMTLTSAYEAAGYPGKGGHASGFKLLKKPEIAERVEEIKAKRAEIAEKTVGVSKAQIVEYLLNNHKLAISIAPPQISGSNKALELLGKELGMFRDQPQEIKGDVHLHFGTPAPSWATTEEPDAA